MPLNNITIQNYLKYNRKLRQYVFIHLHLSKRCSTTAIMHSLLLQWCVKWSLPLQKSPGLPLPPIPNIHTLLKTILHIILFFCFFFIASSVRLLWTSRSHTVLFTEKQLFFLRHGRSSTQLTSWCQTMSGRSKDMGFEIFAKIHFCNNWEKAAITCATLFL